MIMIYNLRAGVPETLFVTRSARSDPGVAFAAEDYLLQALRTAQIPRHDGVAAHDIGYKDFYTMVSGADLRHPHTSLRLRNRFQLIQYVHATLPIVDSEDKYFGYVRVRVELSKLYSESISYRQLTGCYNTTRIRT
jgi:hypothetical protein